MGALLGGMDTSVDLGKSLGDIFLAPSGWYIFFHNDRPTFVSREKGELNTQLY